MKLISLSANQFVLRRSRLMSFIRRYGDGRLTPQGVAALAELSPAALTVPGPLSGAGSRGSAPPGTAVIVALQEGRWIGIAAAIDGGQRACVVVVHPQARSEGVGRMLMSALVEQCGSLICQVAADNNASAAMCRHAGMQPIASFSKENGQEIIRFASPLIAAGSTAATVHTAAGEVRAWRKQSLHSAY
ncbi:N-acetyltransferase [Paenibacillaceae bacterium]|nr:N-acetyltransferase [Paenibacillaceae bacterium]